MANRLEFPSENETASSPVYVNRGHVPGSHGRPPEELAMPTMRIRETVWEPPSPRYLVEKARKGWTLVGLEWERDMNAEEAASLGLACDVPYGLRVAANSLTLEEDPQERVILTAMLDLIVKDDVRFSMVAQELNQKGYRARGGAAWTQSAVFEMLPRLVEVAPTILTSEQWEALKQKL